MLCGAGVVGLRAALAFSLAVDGWAALSTLWRHRRGCLGASPATQKMMAATVVRPDDVFGAGFVGSACSFVFLLAVDALAPSPSIL